MLADALRNLWSAIAFGLGAAVWFVSSLPYWLGAGPLIERLRGRR